MGLSTRTAAQFAGLFVLTSVASLVVAGWVWRRRERRGAPTFVALLLVNAVWTATAGAALVTGDFDAKLLWLKLGVIPAFFIPTLWFLFTLQYTGRTRPLYRAVVALAGVEGALVSVLTLTNERHWLVWTAYRYHMEPFPLLEARAGPLYGLHGVVAYALLLGGMATVLRVLLSARDAQRMQPAVLLVAALLPLSTNLAAQVGWLPVTGLDYTPLASGSATVLVALALYRYRLFDIYPVARDAVVSAIRDPVVVVDDDLHVADYNPAGAALLPTPDPLGAHLPRVLRGSLPDGETLDTDGVASRELTFPAADGDRHYLLDVSPLASAGGGDGYVFIFRDVTERTRKQRELRRQNERLEEFASIVSHDLRNPLNVAAGHLELAREECDSDRLDAVADAHDRMEALVEDLLTLAREGETATDLEPVSVAAAAEACWATVETADATLAVEGDRTVMADEGRLRQLLANLVRNAVEHGGSEVTVTVGSLPDGFYVEDDGPGVPEADREAVFERGYSTAGDGTGFGLAIVETIAEAHGWEVALTAAADGGSRFEVTGCEAAPAEGVGERDPSGREA